MAVLLATSMMCGPFDLCTQILAQVFQVSPLDSFSSEGVISFQLYVFVSEGIKDRVLGAGTRSAGELTYAVGDPRLVILIYWFTCIYLGTLV